jgi:hypothetical protein
MQKAWNTDGGNTMVAKVKEIVSTHGATPQKACVDIKQGNITVCAYTAVLCVSVLEYYAFDTPSPTEEAKRNYRLLAGQAMADFIYSQVGYDPHHKVPAQWKQFHDRVSLTYNAVPRGFFGVFKELADMIVNLGQAGLHIDDSFAPDISVGILWAKHWVEAGLDKMYGERAKYDHNYPEYFPQSMSNPQDAWCYPESALGEFRRWLREKYIAEGKFRKYLEKKVRDKQLPVSFANIAVAVYGIEDKSSS